MTGQNTDTGVRIFHMDEGIPGRKIDKIVIHMALETSVRTIYYNIF